MLDVLVEDIAHRGRKQWYWREQRVGIWHWLLEFWGWKWERASAAEFWWPGT